MKQRILSCGATTALTPIALERLLLPECRRAGRCPAAPKEPVLSSYRTVGSSISAHPAVSREPRRTVWRSVGKLRRRQCSITFHLRTQSDDPVLREKPITENIYKCIKFRNRTTIVISFHLLNCVFTAVML